MTGRPNCEKLERRYFDGITKIVFFFFGGRVDFLLGICRQLGSGCRQLLSSQNQFLGSDTICRQIRVGCRQLNLRLSTHPHRSLQDVEDQ
ncbi:hypothetical protein Taro_000144 [Colocasia esculenta]|uniref:Uncharacterized protein n=1 Tax=Colocasia esculenta TaxID=4460 RepID=A0A843TDV0_COLES|nr:hypothetical protein [Colocasia esculenta]